MTDILTLPRPQTPAQAAYAEAAKVVADHRNSSWMSPRCICDVGLLCNAGRRLEARATELRPLAFAGGGR